MVGGRTEKAHRVSWELRHGPILDGLLVLHRCDRPSCVNPDHLRLGTHRENTNDMVVRGRNAKTVAVATSRHGALNKNSKLNDKAVRDIRARVAAGSESHVAIGRSYGITSACVRAVATRKTWRQVP